MAVHDFGPSERAHIHAFTVAGGDIDALGHANNVSYVRWINDAAIAHSSRVGFGIDECVRVGLAWVVRRHDVEYLRPAFAGEQLEALTWPEAISGATSLRRTLFRRGAEVLARAETLWALFDLHNQRPRRVPEAMLAAYGFRASP